MNILHFKSAMMLLRSCLSFEVNANLFFWQIPLMHSQIQFDVTFYGWKFSNWSINSSTICNIFWQTEIYFWRFTGNWMRGLFLWWIYQLISQLFPVQHTRDTYWHVKSQNQNVTISVLWVCMLGIYPQLSLSKTG